MASKTFDSFIALLAQDDNKIPTTRSLFCSLSLQGAMNPFYIFETNKLDICHVTYIIIYALAATEKVR